MTSVVDRIVLDVPDFDGLRPGDIQLSAPAAHNTIQVGWSRTDAENMPKVPLLVHIEGDTSAELVSVARADGGPLQIEVLSGDLGDLVMHNISEQPVTSLQFRRLASEGSPQWQVFADPEVTLLNNGAAKKVAEVVARFAQMKQTQEK